MTQRNFSLLPSVVCLLLYLADHTYSKEHKEDGSVTFVTALYDIGRGNWSHWQRSFETYIDNFVNVLKISSKLVLFCDKSTLKSVQKAYSHYLDSNIDIVVKPFGEIEFQRYRKIVNQIMQSQDFRKDNEMVRNPEGFSVDYILLMNNKMSFMKHAIHENKFKSSHFFWIDAGYGHGDSNVFPNHSWKPSKILKLIKTVTFITLNDPEVYKAERGNLHKLNIGPAISGGFFGGHKLAVMELYYIYEKTFRSMLLDNIVDDDQNVFLFCYYEIQRLFNLVKGGWFDAFKLF